MGVLNSADVKRILKSLKPVKLGSTEELQGVTTNPSHLLNNGEETVAIDASFYLYSFYLTSYIETWEQVLNAYINEFNRLLKLSSSLKQIIVCIDNPNTVPENKALTQNKRDQQKKNRVDLSPEELSYLKIGVGPIVPYELEDNFLGHEKLTAFKEALIRDRTIKNEIQSWIMAEIIKRRLNRSVWFVVDEVMWKYVKLLDKTGEKKYNLRDRDFVKFKVFLRHELASINITTGSQTGEGELKCFRHVISESLPLFKKNSKSVDVNDNNNNNNKKNIVSNNQKKKSITIISNDTDSLMIILLNMFYLIDPDTDELTQTVYLFDNIEIWNMELLWRCIHDHYKINYEKYRCPTAMETLVFLFIINGCDYTEGLPQVGAKTLWKKYNENPFLLGSREPLGYRLDSPFKEEGEEFGIQQYGSMTKKMRLENIEKSFDPVISTSAEVGKLEQFRFIYIDYNRVYQFIHDLVHGKMLEKEILYYYGRCVWTLGYWCNGCNPAMNFKPSDPFELERTGEPKYGWCKNEFGEVSIPDLRRYG